MARKETLGGARLTADAKNRAWRSLLIGLVIDVGIALVLGLVAAFDSASGWGDLQWGLIGFAVAKSAVQALGSFFLRRVIDPSSIPTPLPPADPGPPADAVEPPSTAIEDATAEPDDAGVEEVAVAEKKPAPRKRPAKKAVSPDDQTRRLQAEINLAQTKAAAPTPRQQAVAKKVAERKTKKDTA